MRMLTGVFGRVLFIPLLLCGAFVQCPVPAPSHTALARSTAERLPLPAWAAADSKRAHLQVDDTGSKYPLVINTWVQDAKLTASDGAHDDYLGGSVAVSGDGNTIVVGAANSAAGGSKRGALYVYTRPETGWATTTAFTAKLTTSDGKDDDSLGRSVAVSADGSTVVAGAPLNFTGGTSRGAVYVYTRPETGWASTAAFTAKLTAADVAPVDYFGSSVSVSGDGSTVVGGAPEAAAGGNRRGAGYVYTQPESGWATTGAFTARLTASDAGDVDSLGWAVAVSADGNTVAVSSENNSAPGSSRGAVYVYTRSEDGWGTTAVFTAKLTASDSVDYDRFGVSVAVSGDGSTLIAGRQTSSAGSSLRGAAYVYTRPEGGWTTSAAFTAKLTASDAADYDNLGRSVAVSEAGNTVIAGAPSNGLPLNNSPGALYIYARPGSGWATTGAFTAKLTASDGVSDDGLGQAVAMSADARTVVGGAPHNGPGAKGHGAAYVWTSTNTPPSPSFTVTPISGDTSTVFQFDASGCTDTQDPPPALEVRWDWENDGVYDTPWSPTKTASHSYATGGTYTVRLLVLDLGGLTNSTTRQVTVRGQTGTHRVFLPLVLNND